MLQQSLLCFMLCKLPDLLSRGAALHCKEACPALLFISMPVHARMHKEALVAIQVPPTQERLHASVHIWLCRIAHTCTERQPMSTLVCDTRYISLRLDLGAAKCCVIAYIMQWKKLPSIKFGELVFRKIWRIFNLATYRSCKRAHTAYLVLASF